MEHERGSETREDIAEGLSRAAHLVVRHLARGTNVTHRAALAALAEDGPTRLTALAAATGVTQPAMTQAVGRMEREGLVVRLIDPEDARATLVDITVAGRALRAERHQSQGDRLAKLLDILSPNDEATLGLALRVALPFIEQLTRHAAQHPQSQPAASLTTRPA